MINKNEYRGQLWPPVEYFQQLSRLYDAIGEDIYLVPLLESNQRLTFSMTGKPHKLIAIIDFPEPDPEQHLYPHMLVFADGSGLNLGKILKISRNTAFNPDIKDVLYEDRPMQNVLMYTPRKLNRDYIQFVSRFALGEILGKKDLQQFSIKAPVEKPQLSLFVKGGK